MTPSRKPTLAVTALEDRTTPAVFIDGPRIPATPSVFAAGAFQTYSVFDAAGAVIFSTTSPFYATNGSARGIPLTSTAEVDVRVATADINGDGVPDLVLGAGPGIVLGYHVQVIDGSTRSTIAAFDAFEGTFTGGVFVAAGDLDGDGKADVVVTPDRGGGPVAAVYSGAGLTAGLNAGANVTRFFGIDDPNFRGGARAAIGDINGDGRADLVVAAGFGGGPRVAVYDGRTAFAAQPTHLVSDFFVFEPTLRNGVYVAAGDLNGDGYADLVVGGGPGGGPRVLALNGRTLSRGDTDTSVANFFAGDPDSRGGVRVAVRPGADGAPRLAAGSGEGAPASVKLYTGAQATSGAAPELALTPFGGGNLFDGVYVG